MAAASFSCIAARCSNGGIGYKGALPWPSIKKDLKFMRQKSQHTIDPRKENAVIMGRLTWESLPPNHRPLSKRFNIVLSGKKSEELPGSPHLVCSSLSAALKAIKSPPLADKIEAVFVLGGERVYEEAMSSPLCDMLYITEVLQDFPCDAFYPKIDTNSFSIIEHHGDPLIPAGILEENGIKYRFTVYKRTILS